MLFGLPIVQDYAVRLCADEMRSKGSQNCWLSDYAPTGSAQGDHPKLAAWSVWTSKALSDWSIGRSNSFKKGIVNLAGSFFPANFIFRSFGTKLSATDSSDRCIPSEPNKAIPLPTMSITLFGITTGACEMNHNNPNQIQAEIRMLYNPEIGKERRPLCLVWWPWF